MSTNRDFLSQKRHNFVTFIKDAVAKRKKDVRYNKFIDKISTFESISMDLFVAAIVEQMVPYSKDPMAFVSKILHENELTTADLTTEELNKVKLYVECFISVVST